MVDRLCPGGSVPTFHVVASPGSQNPPHEKSGLPKRLMEGGSCTVAETLVRSDGPVFVTVSV